MRDFAEPNEIAPPSLRAVRALIHHMARGLGDVEAARRVRREYPGDRVPVPVVRRTRDLVALSLAESRGRLDGEERDRIALVSSGRRDQLEVVA